MLDCRGACLVALVGTLMLVIWGLCLLMQWLCSKCRKQKDTAANDLPVPDDQTDGSKQNDKFCCDEVDFVLLMTAPLVSLGFRL